MSIEYDKVQGILKISQPYHEQLVIKRFCMDQWKLRDTPLPTTGKHVMLPGEYEAQTDQERWVAEHFPGREYVGNFIWICLSHPELAFAVSFLGSHVGKPTLKFWENVKWLGGFFRKHCVGKGIVTMP